MSVVSWRNWNSSLLSRSDKYNCLSSVFECHLQNPPSILPIQSWRGFIPTSSENVLNRCTSNHTYWQFQKLSFPVQSCRGFIPTSSENVLTGVYRITHSVTIPNVGKETTFLRNTFTSLKFTPSSLTTMQEHKPRQMNRVFPSYRRTVTEWINNSMIRVIGRMNVWGESVCFHSKLTTFLDAGLCFIDEGSRREKWEF